MSQLNQDQQRALQIISLAEKFPADPNLAEAHYRAQWYAPEMFFRCPRCQMRFKQNVHVCPNCGLNIEKEVYHCTCCRHKIKELQYGFCIDASNPVLSPDIVVFFTFIKLVLVYFAFRFMVLDLFTIYQNWERNSCMFLNDWVNCPKTAIARLATLRRIQTQQSLFIFDLLNLAFIVISIIYLLCSENYLHTTFQRVANTIQTEDDFSVYVYNIPVLLDNQQESSYVGYKQALTSYFEQLVRNWINQKAINPQNQDYLFRDYVRVAQKYGDNPMNPRRIVTNINLCWDLEELINLRRQKRRIMREYTQKANQNRGRQSYQYWGLDQQTQSKLNAITQAEIEVSKRFVEMNSSPTFVIGRFLGKAFVSFEYQHFMEAVISSVRDSEIFESFREIQVEQAASPPDVYWANLNISASERTQRKVTTFILTFGCILIGFGAVLGLRYFFRKYYRIDDFDTDAGVMIFLGSAGVTILIVCINHFLQWLVQQLTEYEEHETRTREQESELFKMLISSFFNIILSTLVVWRFMKVGIWDRNGLAVQVIVIMIAASLIEVFLSIINWSWIWRWISLKFKYRPGEPILQFQFIYNDEYELPQFNLAERYNYYLWQAYFLAFFSYLVPASNIIGIIVIIVQYFLDRINLLRRSSFHPNYSFTLGKSAVRLFQTTIFIHALGNFISGWILKGTWFQPINVISLLITIFYMIFVWGVIGAKRHPCFYTSTLFEQFSYTDCSNQGKFYHSYPQENPATKNNDFNTYGEKFYGIDQSTITNSMVMNPNPVVGSLPQIAGVSGIQYRSAI